MIFQSLIYDSTPLTSGENEHIFFTHNELDGESNRHQPESYLSQWIFSKNIFKEYLFSFLNIPFYTMIGYEVRKPLVDSHNLPDIDIFLVNKDSFKESIAIEVKKVKYFFDDKGNEILNKLQDVEAGVKQSRKLLEMGFNQVYLMIIIISDGRNLTQNNYVFRGISNQKLKDVYNFPGRDKLDKRIGIIFIEIVQSTGLSINHTGNFNVCFDVMAEKQEQPNSINDKIKQYISEYN